MKYLFLSGILILILACSTDRLIPLEVNSTEGEDLPLPPPYQSNETYSREKAIQFLEKIKPNPAKRKLNNISDLPLTGPKGTRIFFYPYALKNSLGEPVDFPFEYELLEIYTMKDMLLHRKFPVSDGQILKSGGEIYFKLYKDGKEVKIKDPGFPIQINMPSSENTDTGMIRFMAKGELNDTLNWQPMGDLIAVSQKQTNQCIEFINQTCYTYPLQIFKDSYLALGTSFDWINCDRFLLEPKENLVKIKFTSEFKPDEILLFLCFPEINSVIGVNNFESLAMPTDMKVKAVGLAADKEGKLKYHYSEFLSGNNLIIPIKLDDILEQDFLDLLETL